MATGWSFVSLDDHDHLVGPDFVEALRERLVLIHRLLADDGSLYLHLDGRMVFHFRVILDERKKRETDPTLHLLRDLAGRAEKKGEADPYVRDRLKDMLGFFELRIGRKSHRNEVYCGFWTSGADKKGRRPFFGQFLRFLRQGSGHGFDSGSLRST